MHKLALRKTIVDKVQFPVFYEDNHILALSKAAGLLVHGDNTGDETLLDMAKTYIKKKYKKPGAVFLTPIHRIDRPVSGLVLFGRTSKAVDRLNKLFAKRVVHKKYVALVESRPAEMEKRLLHYLKRDTKKNKTLVSKKGGDAKEAILTYQWLGEINKKYIVLIELETGRHHQIRAQLAAEGMPIVGDLKYGAKTKTDGRSIALHAYQMEFIHPVKKELIQLDAPLPKNATWKGVSDFLP